MTDVRHLTETLIRLRAFKLAWFAKNEVGKYFLEQMEVYTDDSGRQLKTLCVLYASTCNTHPAPTSGA